MATDKTDTIPYSVFYDYNGAQGELMITMRNRPLVCLRCHSPDHKRVNCPLKETFAVKAKGLSTLSDEIEDDEMEPGDSAFGPSLSIGAGRSMEVDNPLIILDSVAEETNTLLTPTPNNLTIGTILADDLVASPSTIANANADDTTPGSADVIEAPDSGNSSLAYMKQHL